MHANIKYTGVDERKGLHTEYKAKEVTIQMPEQKSDTEVADPISQRVKPTGIYLLSHRNQMREPEETEKHHDKTYDKSVDAQDSHQCSLNHKMQIQPNDIDQMVEPVEPFLTQGVDMLCGPTAQRKPRQVRVTCS